MTPLRQEGVEVEGLLFRIRRFRSPPDIATTRRVDPCPRHQSPSEASSFHLFTRCYDGKEHWIIKREAEDAIVEADVVEEVAKPTPLAGWCQRCTAGNWIIKREATDEVEDPVPATAETVEPKPLAGWCQRCVAGNWIIKREEDIIYESNW